MEKAIRFFLILLLGVSLGYAWSQYHNGRFQDELVSQLQEVVSNQRQSLKVLDHLVDGHMGHEGRIAAIEVRMGHGRKK
jgi:hypothetical protein